MEISKKKIVTGRAGRSLTDQFKVEDDYNVPDMRDDIGRVITCEGTAGIGEIRRTDAYLNISGKIDFKVLYVTDSLDPGLASLSGSLPFEEMVYVGEEEQTDYIIKTNRVDFTVDLIHSRKMALRTLVELEIHSEAREEFEIPLDTEGEECCKRYEDADVLELHTSGRDIYRIKEEIILPGQKENIDSLLWYDVKMRKPDTRLEKDHLSFSGELQVFCIFNTTGGKTDWVEQRLPYEGKIECSGTEEKFYHHVYETLTDISVEPVMDEDREMRKFVVEATLEMRILIYKEENIRILEDLYSLEKECEIEREEREMEEVIMQNHSKCRVCERLHLPELKNEILQICHCDGALQVENVETVEDKLNIEGLLHVGFLYVRADDKIPFDIWQGIVPFSCRIEMGKECEEICRDMTCAVEHITVEASGNDEVEIKASLSFRCFLRTAVKHTLISRVTLKETDPNDRERQPGIIGYVVKKDENMWELAKRYRTTEESILEMNNLTSKDIKEGQKMLIFREKVSIL